MLYLGSMFGCAGDVLRAVCHPALQSLCVMFPGTFVEFTDWNPEQVGNLNERQEVQPMMHNAAHLLGMLKAPRLRACRVYIQGRSSPKNFCSLMDTLAFHRQVESLSLEMVPIQDTITSPIPNDWWQQLVDVVSQLPKLRNLCLDMSNEVSVLGAQMLLQILQQSSSLSYMFLTMQRVYPMWDARIIHSTRMIEFSPGKLDRTSCTLHDR